MCFILLPILSYIQTTLLYLHKVLFINILSYCFLSVGAEFIVFYPRKRLI